MGNNAALVNRQLMKTLIFRVGRMSLALVGLWLCVGCEADRAEADVVPIFKKEAAGVDAPLAPEIQPPAPAADPSLAGLSGASSLPATNSDTNLPPARLVQSAVLLESLRLSPASSEIVKLAQAGVSEDVVLAYVTNSTRLFGLSADQIVYLNDLGVSSSVITALLHHDNVLDAEAGKKLLTTPGPLPAPSAPAAPPSNTPPSNAPAPIEPSTPPPTGPAVASPETYGAAPQPANVSYFYNSLSPYGNWVQVDGYGLCWQPTVAVVNSSWRPYADNGRWLWTDNGWYWYSDYSWGWAPFHYGRWSSYPRMGWLWVPDTAWGPSWVSWRSTPSHCGWAPLPPEAIFVSGFGLTYHHSRVSLGFDFGFASSSYTFLPLNRFCDRSPHHYFAPHAQVAAIYRESTVINNYVIHNHRTIVNEGIGRERVAHATRREIHPVRIRETPLAATPGTRPERLETDGSSQVVVRPKLPTVPLASPALGQRRGPSEARKGWPVSSGAALSQPPSAAPLASPAAQPNKPEFANTPSHPVQTKPIRVGRALSGIQTDNSADVRFRHSVPRNAPSGGADRVPTVVPPSPNNQIPGSGPASHFAANPEQDSRIRHQNSFSRTIPPAGSPPLAQGQNPAPKADGPPSSTASTALHPRHLNQANASLPTSRLSAPGAPSVERAPQRSPNPGPLAVRQASLPTQVPQSFRPVIAPPQVSRPSPQTGTPVAVPSPRPQFNPPASGVAQPRHSSIPAAQPQHIAAPMARPQPASAPPAASPRFSAPPPVAPQAATPPPATGASPGNKRRD